ncbi:hypothetical protein Barb6_01742 [Bacteroidales bacterium Barb6]|nr:hypothetical protein Barb6_01742 [Bacteroidales bacterium Barb6]
MEQNIVVQVYGKGDTVESCKDVGFQPHMQRSGMWGLRNGIGNGVLQGRYKLQMMVYNAIHIWSSFP